MPADTLSREEIERLQSRLRSEGVCMTCVLRAPEPYGCPDCLNTGYERGEVARLAQARAEGYREGWLALRREVYALHEDTIEKHHDIGQHDLEGKQGAFARGRCIEAKSIARALGALTPPPAEPAQPDWPTRCAALEADGIAARKRVTALEAENAKLRERNAELEDGLWPLAKIGGEIDQYVPQLHDDDGTSVAIGLLRRARALLQGGPDAG
jgi:hypothetical protein